MQLTSSNNLFRPSRPFSDLLILAAFVTEGVLVDEALLFWNTISVSMKSYCAFVLFQDTFVGQKLVEAREEVLSEDYNKETKIKSKTIHTTVCVYI